ncbi:MAG: glucose-methanol-choline oxidoreductase, partial [Chitinophagaceae bacterium]
FLKSDPLLNRPDIQFHFVPLGIASDYSTDIYDINTFSKKDGLGILTILIRPESRGTVSLKSANPKDAPVINHQALSAEKDRTTLLYALKKAMEVITAPALTEYTNGTVDFPTDAQTDEALMTHIRKSLETLYHPVGTCKMGTDAMAVTDAQLRVHKVKRLRVVDASVMPTIVSGNTNAAVIMIAEKAADMIIAGE